MKPEKLKQISKTARPKAYSYLRFSTPEQSKGDSHRRQTKLAEEYAKRRNLDLDTKLTFHDLGVSAYRGANAETGRLADFLELVKVGTVLPGSYLLVENLDRISRRTARRAAEKLSEICDAGITVVTLTDGREYTEKSLDDDPISFIVAVLGFMRAHEESAVKAGRLREVWEGKRAKAASTPLTSVCPAWLRLDKAAGKFEVIRERAEIVRRIFGDTLQGCSPHSIAEAFNREPVPVFGRGMHWHRSYVLKILENPAVIGRIIPHTTSYESGKVKRTPTPAIEGYYPAILDDETFQRVQSLRRPKHTNPGSSTMRGKHAGNEVQNIFGGLGRCARCGGTMTKLNKGSGGKWSYLVCAAAKTGAGCFYESIPYGQVESAFLDNARRLIATAPTGGDNGKEIDAEIARAEASLEGISAVREKLLDAASVVPTPELTRRLRDLKQEQETLDNALTELADRRAETSGALVRSKLADLLAAVEAKPLNKRLLNSILRQTLSSVDVDAENGMLLLHWKHGGKSELAYSGKAFGFENEKQRRPKPTIGANNRKRRTPRPLIR